MKVRILPRPPQQADKMNQTIEQKVAAAILEKPIAELELNGKTYTIAPPSTSTLILVSEIISTLPSVESCERDKIVPTVLHYAKDYKQLGDLVATLILGRKGLTEERVVERYVVERYFFGLLKRIKTVKEKVVIDRKSELAQLILDEVRPSVLMDIIVRRLKDMEIGDFFGITTSLSEANLLKPTAEVE